MPVSKQARRDAKQLFRSCLAEGRLDEDRVRKVVNEVLNRKPHGYLPMLNQFQRLVALEIAKRTATVESAVEPPAEMKQDITRRLADIYGEGLTVQFKLNPGLIGGLRVRVGSDVFDGSIDHRLGRLAQDFQHFH